ncbi:hypothetical protein TNCV_3995451 [Trichonephila clavipes]|nr:hypothetical protein TNCV_3995451 [Trichonephila clavipes]
MSIPGLFWTSPEISSLVIGVNLKWDRSLKAILLQSLRFQKKCANNYSKCVWHFVKPDVTGSKRTPATDARSIEVYVGITFQDGDRFNSCQVIYSQFGLAIHQNDHQARRRFVEWAQNQIAVVPDFHKRILFSDEAHFWLSGYVNKQNCRIWSEANPQVSCDLTPLDYFLWGYVKSLVFADKPQTLDHLEGNIRRVIADIRPQMLEKVIEYWTSRLDYIRASPMPEIMFKM